MKTFYIETNQLINDNRNLRFVFNEDNDGAITFVKVLDPLTKEEVLFSEMKKNMSTDALLNIVTAHKANYRRVYTID